MTTYERLGQSWSSSDKVSITHRYSAAAVNTVMGAAEQPLLIETKHLYREIVQEAVNTGNWDTEGIQILQTDASFSTSHKCTVMCC